MGMLFRGVRVLIQIAEQVELGVTDSKIIAKTLGVHPFAVAKNLSVVKKSHEPMPILTKLFDTLVSIDTNIKTGKMPVESIRGQLKKTVATHT